MNAPRTPLLSVAGLSVGIRTPAHETVWPVRGVDFELARGEALGVVGESGSGKSMVMLSLMGLLPGAATRRAERIVFDGEDLANVPDKRFARDFAGQRIGMIFQEPMTSLNPVYPIGHQLIETTTLYHRGEATAARKRALMLLDRVGVPKPDVRMRQYPHELSGGLRQRVMIAMALMNSPDLIIADEPTTALDVTIKAQVLELLAELRTELNTAMILVSHDIDAVARAVDRVTVMYAGALVEAGRREDVLEAPMHPYTQGLLACAPRADTPRGGGRLGAITGHVPSPFRQLSRCAFSDRCALAYDACRDGEPAMAHVPGRDYRCVLPAARLTGAGAGPAASGDRTSERPAHAVDLSGEPVLALESVTREFVSRRGWFGRPDRTAAVDRVDLALHHGEILALVGESGSGKTTLAKMMLGLIEPTAGTIRFQGRELGETRARERARTIQPVFQDPDSSLNPLRTVGEAIARPLEVHGRGNRASRRERVREVMALVGLPDHFIDRHPGQMSGGQKQRVAIARALVLEPAVLICDEPTSALDISVQAQILNLLLDLRTRLDLTYFLITHDLAVVRYLATRVAVMQYGRIVEQGPTEHVFEQPQHDYTRELLASARPPRAIAV